jgi:peptidyl-tRNA hydrolase ICT1
MSHNKLVFGSQLYKVLKPQFLRAFSATSYAFTTEAEIDSARQWLKTFNKSLIPPTVGDVSYSRSSGPGGQNVNKYVSYLPTLLSKQLLISLRVNSKAQLRVHLDRLLPIIPPALHSALRSSRYFAKDNTLLIQSDDSRKQSANKDTCWSKLCVEISRVGKEVIPGETSDEQKERVKELQKRENEVRIQSKKQHAGKKASRSNGGLDG